MYQDHFLSQDSLECGMCTRGFNIDHTNDVALFPRERLQYKMQQGWRSSWSDAQRNKEMGQVTAPHGAHERTVFAHQQHGREHLIL